MGYWLVVRPARAAGRLVIFDRYFHDLLVDPRRYRYGAPLWLAHAVGWLVPKPDLWVILDAPADVLQARSQDVSASETARQLDGYRALARNFPEAVVVDATLPPERVAAHVERAIASHDAHEIPVCHGYERR